MNKQELYRAVEAKREEILTLSDKIWDYAELSMLETKSTAAYVALLKEEGFQVQENLCGIPTAFSGAYGSGSPKIGILAEYDALSGLSQAPGVAQKQPLCEGGSGQGCGHNLLGAASLSAAIAIKDAIAAGKLHGTVVFYGCPGEEGCAGKTFMARDGMFRDLDAAITWHPGSTNEISVDVSAACIQVEYSFHGIAAHAAGNPHMGRSALDAVELMHMGVQFLREHMPPKSSVHYSITDAGGVSPNVVQPEAKTVFMVRAETVRKAKELRERVDRIAQGAALMTDTTFTMRQIDGTASTLSNRVLEQVLYENMQQVPVPEYTREEWAFVQAIHDTYPANIPGQLSATDPQVHNFAEEKSEGGKRALNDFILPYVPASPFSPGSTDVGDVSWLTPTAQFTTATWPSAVPGHSWQIVATGKTGIAYKGMLQAAKILAGAAADLMTKPELLEKAKAEFRKSAAEGYDCPITKEVTF